MSLPHRGRGRDRRDPAAPLDVRGHHEVITTTLTGEVPAEFRLTWTISTPARRRLERHLFGKRILFTNRDHWIPAEVVAGYRSQNQVKSGFRQMKDARVVSFGPLWHWTNSKIRVHVFHCVLALAIAHLMRRDVERAGLHLSVPALLADLFDVHRYAPTR